MTNKQAAVLASRVLCIWFFYLAVSNVATLPELIVAASRASLFSGVYTDPSLGVRIERTLFVGALGAVFHLCIELAAAIFFYRSAWFVRFLMGAPADADIAQVTTKI